SVEAFTAAARAPGSLWTSSYVLVETVALLQARVGLTAVHDLEDRILPLVAVEWVGAEIHARAMTALRRADRRELSLVDCVSFELMRARGEETALALDRHFREAGFKVRPS